MFTLNPSPMSYRTELRSLDSLASHLPFALDETERVNEAYCRYVAQPGPSDSRLVDLWTYCYIRRYFLIKFLRETAFRSSELEQVVERTYRKVESRRHQLEQLDKYAQWVSVICRNTYVNFVSRRRAVDSLESVPHPAVEMPEIELDVDAGAVFLALTAAIAQLPAFLQSTARMRYVENLSYEEIARITGKRVPTIRSYTHKICARFRKDSGLSAWADRYL